VFIKTEQKGKKNGKKPLCFDIYTVCLLTLFQLNCYFQGECAIHDITAHRPTFVSPPLLPA
jgi:hypothetical protein